MIELDSLDDEERSEILFAERCLRKDESRSSEDSDVSADS